MRTEVSETTSYRFHEDICSLLRSVRCCTSLEDCSSAFAAESYPASVPGELGLDLLPLVAHPVTVILVKVNTRSAATKRLRKRILLAMMMFHQSFLFAFIYFFQHLTYYLYLPKAQPIEI